MPSLPDLKLCSHDHLYSRQENTTQVCYVHIKLYAKLVAVAFDLDMDTVSSVTRKDTEIEFDT